MEIEGTKSMGQNDYTTLCGRCRSSRFKAFCRLQHLKLPPYQRPGLSLQERYYEAPREVRRDHQTLIYSFQDYIDGEEGSECLTVSHGLMPL